MDCLKLITKNATRLQKARIKGKALTISLDNRLQYSQIARIISTLYSALFSRNIQNVVFYADSIGFADKLTYILFECLVYALIKNFKKNVYFLCNEQNNIITAAGIEHSLLGQIIANTIDNQTFVQQFDKQTMNLQHFRQIIKHDVSPDFFSTLYMNVHSFLYNAGTNVEDVQHTKLDRKYMDRIAEIVVELVSNASEHAISDCLVDIDISADWEKISSGESVVPINIVILNFSQILLGDNLCKKIENFDPIELDNTMLSRYKVLKNAYEYHSAYFGKNYTKEDFFNIASFQNQVSSRLDKVTGGTGLPKLLQILLEQTDLDVCYVISGSRVLRFTLDNLQFDGDWVGFNASHNFISDIPSSNAICQSNLF